MYMSHVSAVQCPSVYKSADSTVSSSSAVSELILWHWQQFIVISDMCSLASLVYRTLIILSISILKHRQWYYIHNVYRNIFADRTRVFCWKTPQIPSGSLVYSQTRVTTPPDSLSLGWSSCHSLVQLTWLPWLSCHKQAMHAALYFPVDLSQPRSSVVRAPA